jgi:hypothetical protein
VRWYLIERGIVLCYDILHVIDHYRELILMDIKVIQVILVTFIIYELAPVAYRRKRSKVVFWALRYCHERIEYWLKRERISCVIRGAGPLIYGKKWGPV